MRDGALLEFAFWSFAMTFFRRTLLALVPAISLFGQSTLAIVEKKAGKVGFYTEEGPAPRRSPGGPLPT